MYLNGDDFINLGCGGLNINGFPSREYQVCYGEAKSPTNSADFGDTINYDNPEVG
jgi:hypothetical protein